MHNMILDGMFEALRGLIHAGVCVRATGRVCAAFASLLR